MDIKDFAKTELPKNENENEFKEKKTMEETKEEYGDLVTEFVKRYGNMEEDQLLKEMFKLIYLENRLRSYPSEEWLHLQQGCWR